MHNYSRYDDFRVSPIPAFVRSKIKRKKTDLAMRHAKELSIIATESALAEKVKQLVFFYFGTSALLVYNKGLWISLFL